jgi:hypothetical protein
VEGSCLKRGMGAKADDLVLWANAADLCAPFHLRSWRQARRARASRYILGMPPNHAISSILKLPMYLALIGSDRDSNCDSKVPLGKTNFRIYYEVIP